MDDSAKVRYNIIIGKYLLTELGLNMKLSEHFIKVDNGPLKGSSAPMVDLGTYEIINLNTGNITPGELFMNDYAEKKWMRTILYFY